MKHKTYHPVKVPLFGPFFGIDKWEWEHPKQRKYIWRNGHWYLAKRGMVWHRSTLQKGVTFGPITATTFSDRH